MFLERDVIASYLSDLTRFDSSIEWNLSHRGMSLYMVARGFSLQKKRYKILKSNATDYYRRSSESRRWNG